MHPSPLKLTACLPFLHLQWHDAIDYVHSAAVADVLADFDGIDATVMDILQRYRVSLPMATTVRVKQLLGRARGTQLPPLCTSGMFLICLSCRLGPL